MRDRLILTVAALVAFGASLGSTFHFDDYAIFSDPVLTSPSGWWEVWRPVGTRPLTYFTFWLNHQLGGRNPAGYHAVNLALHLAAVLLLYEVLALLCHKLVPDDVAQTLCLQRPDSSGALSWACEKGRDESRPGRHECPRSKAGRTLMTQLC